MISRNIGFLTFLYFLQGLPYGLQSRFLPLYFRTHGMSLSQISYFKLLLAPWMLKALWAPFVDHYGTKKTWLSYSMFGLFVTCLYGMTTSPEYVLQIGTVLFMFNLLTATQDIAVDGLAIEILRSSSELATGNVAQVVGYKIGMVFSGGIVTWLSGVYDIAWGTLFVGLAMFYLVAYMTVNKVIPSKTSTKTSNEQTQVDFDSQCNSSASLVKRNEEKMRELSEQLGKREQNEEKDGIDQDHSKAQGSSSNTSGSERMNSARNRQATGAWWFVQHFQDVLASSETRWIVGYVFIYKLGEQSALTMIPLYLVDKHTSTASVGFWTGVVGQGVSIFGSVLGGWLVSWYRYTPYKVILQCSLLRPALLALLMLVVMAWPDHLASVSQNLSYGCIIAVMCLLLLCSGVVTTTTFTLMMFCSQMSPSNIQASHYTTVATVEVLGKLAFSILIGPFADVFGYPVIFVLCVLLALLVIPVLYKCPVTLMHNDNNSCKSDDNKR